MPINIPTKYVRREELPASLGAPRKGGGGGAAVAKSISRAGQIIEKRVLELKRERDTTIAQNAYNEFQDAAREQLFNEESGLLNQRGEAIYDLDSRYNEWFNKFHGSFMAKRFDTDSQANMFNELAQAKRDRDLDSLSKHIMREHEENKKTTANASILKAETEVRTDPSKTELIVAETINKYDSLYPDTDNTIQHDQIKGRFWSAAVQETINIDAGLALELIEQRKKELGGAYTQWKNTAEAELKTQLIDGLQADLQEKYEFNGVPNFAKMRRDLTHRKNVPRDVKFEVRKWLDAYQIQYENERTSAIKDGHDQEELAVGRAYMEGNFQKVQKLLRESRFLKGDELKTWSNAVKNAKKEEIFIDPAENAAEIVTINRQISEGDDPKLIRNRIIQSTKLGKEDKEQYLNKLETKLGREVEDAVKWGSKWIESSIIPKRSQMSKLIQAPIETRQTMLAQDALYDWVRSQKSPSIDDIKKKAMELAIQYKPTMEQIIEDMVREQAIQKVAE